LWDESLDRLEDYEFLLRLSANYVFRHVKKVTCEYRFYTDGSNSIYTDRYKALAALEKIYQRNPVDDPDLLVKRQNVIDASKGQIQKIEEILSRTGNSKLDTAAIREIIRVVVQL
jgi:ferritin-like metal-binding protein YciE